MNDHDGTSSSNIKKKSASHIYWGTDIQSGWIRSIHEVKSGLQCGCKCPNCGTELVAKKGAVRAYHFAHKDNNDCVFPNEFAIYQLTRDILVHIRRITLPSAALVFPGTSKPKEVISKAHTIKLDVSPEYRRKDNIYPPELLITWHGATFRILLDFNNYFDDSDFQKLIGEAREKDYALLKYDAADSGEPEEFTKDRMIEMLLNGSDADWLYNRCIEKWRKKYIEAARAPERHGDCFECPLHKDYMNGQYCASIETCRQCAYNIASSGSPQCLAFQGYEKKADFDRDELTRQEHMAQIRERNEKRIEQKRQERERREQERKAQEERQRQEQKRREQERARFEENKRREQERREEKRKENVKWVLEWMKRRRIEQAGRESVPREQGETGSAWREQGRLEMAQREQTEEQLLADIEKDFDPGIEAPYIDQYYQRWVKCVKCGAIKRSFEFPPEGYQFRIGICRDCSKS